MKNWLRVAICIMLIVSILAMALSVYAVDPTPEPTAPIWENERVDLQLHMAAYYVYKMLNTWGIHVEYNGVDEFTIDIKNWLVQIMLDYCIDMGITVLEWIAPWIFQNDFWGNILVNDRAVRDIDDFCQWFINKYVLEDNDTVEVTVPGTSLGEEYVVYQTPFTFYNVSGNEMKAVTRVTSNTPLYVMLTVDASNSTQVYLRFLSNSSNAEITLTTYNLTNQTSTVNGNVVLSNPNNTNTIWYNNYNGTFNGNQTFWNPDWAYDFSDYNIYVMNTNAFGQLMNNYTDFEVVSDRIAILTTILNYPSIDDDYTDGDSLTIIDDKPDYSIIDWDGTVSVTNLPAVISTGSIDNPHLEEAYRPIQGLITYAKDGIGVCTALLYELPDEMVYMWYGLIASIVLWGMIKLMREH